MIKKTCILALLGTFAVAQAAVVERFNYTNGALGNTATGGTGQTGNWQLTSTSTDAATASIIDYTWATPTGYGITPVDKAITGSAFSHTAAFQLTTAVNFDSNSEVYFSFLARSNGGSSGLISLETSAGVEKARLYQTVGGPAMTASIGDTPAGIGNRFGNDGIDVLVIGRITTVASGSDTIAIDIVQNTQTIAGSFTADASASAVTTGSANYIEFWNFANAGGRIGEFRMGSTYDSVTIPEPSTFALVGIALGALVFFRRRK
jgi:hypothetical protein